MFGVLTCKYSFLRIYLSYTLLGFTERTPRDDREKTDSLPAFKKALFLKLIPKKVVSLPKKVDSFPEKVDLFPNMIDCLLKKIVLFLKVLYNQLVL